MKQLLELGNRYSARSSWKDFALTKFCLCAMGVMIGANLPKKNKKCAMAAAGGVFAATYIVLMKKVFTIAKEMIGEKK
ncbi:MAG: hypothetical protein IJH91_01580 [Mogibacterium sp.]|nr:hypothetical protein [Mogibacterium sp.]